MECTFLKEQVKLFAKCLQCMAKIGDELSIEILHEKLSLTTLNAHKSAFVVFTFHASFFERFAVLSSGVKKCKVQLKFVLASFKHLSGAHHMSMHMEESRLVIELHSSFNICKTNRINFEDCEIMQAVYARENYACRMQTQAKLLAECISNFDTKTINEITLSLEPDGDHLLVKSHVDEDVTDLRSVLITSLSIETHHFELFEKSADGVTATPSQPQQQQQKRDPVADMTFSLKDFKAFLSFCETTNQSIQIYMGIAGGGPILFSASSESGQSSLEAELLLACINVPETEQTTQSATPEERAGQVKKRAAAATNNGSTFSPSPQRTGHKMNPDANDLAQFQDAEQPVQEMKGEDAEFMDTRHHNKETAIRGRDRGFISSTNTSASSTTGRTVPPIEGDVERAMDLENEAVAAALATLIVVPDTPEKDQRQNKPHTAKLDNDEREDGDGDNGFLTNMTEGVPATPERVSTTRGHSLFAEEDDDDVVMSTPQQ